MPPWNEHFGGWRPVNLGLSADRLEQMHYRVEHGDFARAKPGVVVLMGGTNNLAADRFSSPRDTAKGVFELAQRIRGKTGGAVLIISILPSGYETPSPLRQRILATNTLLREGLVGRRPAGIHWLDVHDMFLDAAGQWKPHLSVDGTHLSAQGYQVLAAAIAPRLKALLGVPPP